MLHDPYKEVPELFERIFKAISETNSWIHDKLNLELSTEDYLQVNYVEGFEGPKVSLKCMDGYNLVTVEVPVILLDRMGELPKLKRFKLFNVIEVWVSHEYVSRVLSYTPWGKSNDPMVDLLDISMRDSITLYRSSIPPTSYGVLRRMVSEIHEDLIRAPISDYYFTELGSKTLKTLKRIVDMGFEIKDSAAIIFNATVERAYGVDLNYLKNLAHEKLRINRSLDKYVIQDGKVVWERVKKLLFTPNLSLKEIEEEEDSLKVLINKIFAKKEKKKEELTYMSELKGALKKRGKFSE